ncbi:MAG: flavodoxin, partial [Lachnospiraceae bacterium]|nr:flavodoxin [Lachnospiraceae bacterium]
YDIAGKKVIPFCTSGGSGIGDSAKNLQELAAGAKVVEGKRLTAMTSEKELKEWAEQVL